MWELQKADAAGEARAAADKPGPQGTEARNDFDKAIEALSSTVEAERAAAQAEEEAIELDRIARAAEIDAAYAEFTGEKFGAIHYLRLLNYVESDYTQYVKTAEGRAKLRAKQQERERLFKTSQLDGAQRTEKERDHFGWVVRCIHWGQD